MSKHSSASPLCRTRADGMYHVFAAYKIWKSLYSVSLFYSYLTIVAMNICLKKLCWSLHSLTCLVLNSTFWQAIRLLLVINTSQFGLLLL